jgi:hypothetical protein
VKEYHEFKIVAILPEVSIGVEKALQLALDEADQAGFDLKTLTPYREGLLAVFIKPYGKK